MAMKPLETIRNILVHPKDKQEPREGVYTIDCENCEKKYTGANKKEISSKDKSTQERSRKCVPKQTFHKGTEETI